MKSMMGSYSFRRLVHLHSRGTTCEPPLPRPHEFDCSMGISRLFRFSIFYTKAHSHVLFVWVWVAGVSAPSPCPRPLARTAPLSEQRQLLFAPNLVLFSQEGVSYRRSEGTLEGASQGVS